MDTSLDGIMVPVSEPDSDELQLEALRQEVLEHTRVYLAPTYSPDRETFTVLPPSRESTELRRIMNAYFALKGGRAAILAGNTRAEGVRRYLACRSRDVSVSFDSFTAQFFLTTLFLISA